MKALAPGRCIATYEYDGRTFRCSLRTDHANDHQYRRGSWPLIVWPNIAIVADGTRGMERGR